MADPEFLVWPNHISNLPADLSVLYARPEGCQGLRADPYFLEAPPAVSPRSLRQLSEHSKRISLGRVH